MIINPGRLEPILKEAPRWAPLLDRALLLKPSALEPNELRYLRLRVGWTAAEVAQARGVGSNVTVARWEGGARRIPRPTEQLFRLFVASALGAPPLRTLLMQFRSSWRQAGAPVEIHLLPEEDRFEYRWRVCPQRIPRSLHRCFWDTAPLKLDLKRHARYIITRVLEKGDLEDWSWLRWTYGEERLRETLEQNRQVSPATVALWREILLPAPAEG